MLYQLKDSLQLSVEVFHETSRSAEEQPVTGFNVSGSYELVPHYHLLFSVGRGIQNTAVNQISIYGALQVSY